MGDNFSGWAKWSLLKLLDSSFDFDFLLFAKIVFHGQTDQPTDRSTDQPTNRPTDKLTFGIIEAPCQSLKMFCGWVLKVELSVSLDPS